MRIPAKFPGKCAKCGGFIQRGDTIEYADKRAYHPKCYEADESEPPSEDARSLADRLGFIDASELDQRTIF